MAGQERTYCRFCAECKNFDKLVDLETDVKKCEETLQKLSSLNVLYVDVSSKNGLPKTVCFVCYDSLNKAYEFLNRLKQAQSILTEVFVSNENLKSVVSDDDCGSGFDDLFASEQPYNDDDIKIKSESCSPTKRQETLATAIPSRDSFDIRPDPVKSEPKEESIIPSYLDAPTGSADGMVSFDQSLNVQALLDAAMCDLPFSNDVTLYAAELPDLSKRVTKHWSDYPWVCFHCNNEFSDLEMLRIHSKELHKKCSAFTCIDCKENVIFDEFEIFIKHVRKHRKSLRHLCPYCDIKTELLKEHIKSHFIETQKACKACGEILNIDDTYEKHILDYSMHKRKRKPRRKPGTPVTKDELTCKLCFKVYKNLNSLRDHNKLHIDDRKRDYTCDRCGKTFYNKGTLTSHIMSHDKIRPHICRICNKSFLFPNMLRRHVEMHSGVKPFSCEQCGRCFRLQYQLNAHKIIHTDSMPYVCQYCSKAFRFKQILKNHERQHTGAKPYSCQHCSMEFTNWSNYNKHMKRRHNTDTSKKKITPDGVFPINPETGLIISIDDPIGTAEWKSRIMKPCKRGKKKAIKQEDTC